MKQNKYGVVNENGADANKWMVNSSELSGIDKSVLDLFDKTRDTVSRIYIPKHSSYNGQTFASPIVLNVSRGVQSSDKAGFIHALYGDDITAGDVYAADAIKFDMNSALSDSEANNRPRAADGYDEKESRYVELTKFSNVNKLDATSEGDVLNILTLLLQYKHVAIDADNQQIIDAAIYETLTKLPLPTIANRISFNTAATTVDAVKQSNLCGIKDLSSAGSQLQSAGYAVYKIGSLYNSFTKNIYQQLLFGGAARETQQYLARHFDERSFDDASAEKALDELDNALKLQYLNQYTATVTTLTQPNVESKQVVDYCEFLFGLSGDANAATAETAKKALSEVFKRDTDAIRAGCTAFLAAQSKEEAKQLIAALGKFGCFDETVVPPYMLTPVVESKMAEFWSTESEYRQLYQQIKPAIWLVNKAYETINNEAELQQWTDAYQDNSVSLIERACIQQRFGSAFDAFAANTTVTDGNCQLLLSAMDAFGYSDAFLQERIASCQQSQSFEQRLGQRRPKNFQPRQDFLEAEKTLLSSIDVQGASGHREVGEVELRLNKLAFKTVSSSDLLPLLWGMGTVIVGAAVPTLLALILAAVNIPWEHFMQLQSGFFAAIPASTLIYYLPTIVATLLAALLYYFTDGKPMVKCKKALLTVLFANVIPYFVFALVSIILYFV
jgi:hypothetical protein